MLKKHFVLILASASQRRKALLDSVGVEVEVLATDIDETISADETPQAYVARMAQEKAQAAANILSQMKKPANAILAADTIVSQGIEIFGKPRDKDDAVRTWRLLSDSEHQVMSAICLMSKSDSQLKIVTTDVHFSVISDEQMQRYWQTGEPADKAGAYAIQGHASAWVQEIRGSYSNVVGLPLFEVNHLLKTINRDWL